MGSDNQQKQTFHILQIWHNYLSLEKSANYPYLNHFYLGTQMQKASDLLGLPLSCVVPVRNYSEELDLDMHCDILLLSAVIQMLRFADNYFDDVSNLLENAAITE